MAADERRKKSEGPRLELRQNRAPFYGDEVKGTEHEARLLLDNRAFYLIERHAIQLRRLRWAQSVQNTPADAGEPLPVHLEHYSRPPKQEQRDTVLTRSRKWVASLLKRNPEKDQ